MNNVTLPSPLSELFEAREPEARLNRVWYRIESRRRRRVPARQRLVLLAAAFGVLALGAWLCVRRALPEASVSHALPVESVVEPSLQPRELDFGDGARITVGPGARLEVLENAERSVTLALRRGLAQFDIRPGGVRRWRIESAGVTVEVVGTQFSIERSAGAVRVEVQRGRVLVRGEQVPDQVQALDAGRVLTVEAPAQPATLRTAPLDSSPAPSASAAEPVAPPPPTAAASAPEAPAWRRAALAEDWRQAWERLGPDGLAQQSQRAASVEELFMLADVARRSGHPAAAVAPLQKIVERRPQAQSAGVAAFTLGRIWIDALGNPKQAAITFERALTLELPAALAEDARARLVQAFARAGDSLRAHAAAEEYRRRYPLGARRGDVDRWSPAE